MGIYTPNQAFYKPEPTEFVDVDTQVNYNLRRADERVRAMIEWQYTEAAIISGNEPRDVGYKFFKAATNTFYICGDPSLDLVQHSSNGDTDEWTTGGLAAVGGYRSVDFNENQLSYRVEPTDKQVSWRGNIMLNDTQDQIPVNTNIVVFTMPSFCTPARSKYFHVHMGIATAGYSIARILFKNTGEIEINRMGIAQTNVTERYVSFNDISYPTNDT